MYMYVFVSHSLYSVEDKNVEKKNIFDKKNDKKHQKE